MSALTTSRTALEPMTLAEAMKFAEVMASSSLIPRDYQGKPANVLVAVQWGREIGLGPLQALQSIAVINNRPALWGDAAIALVRGHPACQSIREGVGGEGDARHGWCEVVRKGEEPQVRTFCVADAKRAGLWGKSGPWQQYPDRMLQMRARGFALRDVFPDALRGVVLAEEAQDTPPREVPNMAASDPLLAMGLAPWSPTYIDASGKVHTARDVATWRADWVKRILGAEKAGRLDDLRAAAERNRDAILHVAEREPEAAAEVDAAIRAALMPKSPDVAAPEEPA